LEQGHEPKLYFGNPNLYRTMLAEVKLVDTSEETGRHCMHMENVCYGREELLYLNMVRQGLIGEVLHGEAAYIHDLRRQMKHEERGTGSWRTDRYINRNGNLYPCHGLGPVAQYMSLARTEDTFGRLVSFSSASRGRELYAEANFPPDHEWNTQECQAGDISTSLIQTALGRTIMVQWDVQSPRPYTRHNLIQGTRGTLAGFPNRLAIEGSTDFHEWTEGDAWEEFVEQYEHPLCERLGELAEKVGGHGGMDFSELYRMVECLRKGEPLDQNVYEGLLLVVGRPAEREVREGGWRAAAVPGLHPGQLGDDPATGHRRLSAGAPAVLAPGPDPRRPILERDDGWRAARRRRAQQPG